MSIYCDLEINANDVCYNQHINSPNKNDRYTKEKITLL